MKQLPKYLLIVAAVSVIASDAPRIYAQQSAPAMLQWFDGSYKTMERRTVDFFAAGYGGVWVPPTGRADSGNQSVGYDVYNRFDLGSPGAPTLYGTETGLKTTTASLQRAGGRVYVDLVWNHNGFRDGSTSGFVAGGGYPGFVLSSPGTTDGDFHSAFVPAPPPGTTDTTAYYDQLNRLSGLIDINQSLNIQLIRNPVTAGNAQNIPAGTFTNIPTEANRRFYQNRTGTADRFLFDPTTGESNIPVYDFDATSATQGTPVAENALGYLMRNAQWMVQNVGVDGFRLDATKHMPPWVLNYLDRAVYRTKTRTLLNGAPDHVFSFGEYFDGNSAKIQTTIRKDINDADPGRIGGNRDALDFPLYFAMQSNLSTNGLQNNWNSVVNASLDRNDDQLANNGSQGVAFVSSHDKGPPALQNVAYAYTLMRPGNTIVYFNAREFGTGRSFPDTGGRGDALGGLYGTNITTLVDIRNRYSQGNYLFRITEKETLIIERQNSLVAGYSNRGDAGYDSRTALTAFAPGTPLIELTGNAADPNVDPGDNIPSLVVVNGDRTVNLRVPRNGKLEANGSTSLYGKGYVIYAPSGPQGSLSLTNVAMTLAAETATDLVTNATARVSSIPVIRTASFDVRLQTNIVNLLGFYRDPDADGDNAFLKVNSGINVNSTPGVDIVTPNSPLYGFENFTTTRSPLIGGGPNGTAGTGLFVQTLDTTQLPEGMNYVEVRAFRKRNSGEPAIFSSWRQGVYIDRLPPDSTISSFSQIGNNPENRRALVRSVDLTANNVHVLLDLPAALTQAEVLARVSGATNAAQTDRDLWQKDFTFLASGNHVLTVVTYEETGTINIQRYPGQFVQSIFGAGLGDLDFNGLYLASDISLFETQMYSRGTLFNPAGDLNADGTVDFLDLPLLGDRLIAVGASTDTMLAYSRLRRSVIPEPAAALPLLCSLPLLSRRRRNKSRTTPDRNPLHRPAGTRFVARP